MCPVALAGMGVVGWILSSGVLDSVGKGDQGGALVAISRHIREDEVDQNDIANRDR